MHFNLTEVIVEGERVVVAWDGYLTRPGGEVDELYGIEIFRVREGKIVEIWNSKEWPGLWQASPLG